MTEIWKKSWRSWSERASQMARILGKLPPEAWKRTGQHTERGPLTLERLLTLATNHIAHHVKFIDEKRAAP